MATPGRKRLFLDDDRVQVSLPNEQPKFAAVSNYDTQSRKMLVRYEGTKTVDKNWINIKYIERVDDKGKLIPRVTRSRTPSRGRSQSGSRKEKSKSPVKKSKTISGRTRSKSRERQPTADFSADEAVEPIKVKAKKPTSPKKSVGRPKSPARTPKKNTTVVDSETPKPKRSSEKKKLPATPAVEKIPASPMKDAEFSADEEEIVPVASAGDELAKAAEQNSKDVTEAVQPAPDSARLCGMLGLCGAKAVSAAVCCAGQCIVSGVVAAFNFIVLILRLTLLNIPMIACFLLLNYSILFLVDKKNLRVSSFYPHPKLPELPVERMSWTWLSNDKDVWLNNCLNIWSLMKFPAIMSAAIYAVQYLKDDCMGGYKIILNVGRKRINTPVNLRKVWLTVTLATGFVLYAESMMPYFDKLMPFENPVTPIVKHYFLTTHSYAYDALCAVYRNTSKFYFYLLVLAFFKAYQDFDFDLDINWKSWFMNTEDTTSPQTRFLVNFCSELFIQTSFLVLATRNPTTMYLWIIFNTRFVLSWLATRGDTEELSVRRLFQGNNVSGFHFYTCAVFKVFCYTNMWRFISKPERLTTNPYRLAIFALCQGSGFLFSLLSTKDYPSDKRNGLHSVIRQTERLSEACQLGALVALSSPSFGTVPLFVGALYLLTTLLETAWQEEAQLVKSRSKWESYFNRVPHKFIPMVY